MNKYGLFEKLEILFLIMFTKTFRNCFSSLNNEVALGNDNDLAIKD